METPKWRISKACQECRVHKTRCSGIEPCQRCVARSVPCVYRSKARTRTKKSLGAVAAATTMAASAASAAATATATASATGSAAPTPDTPTMAAATATATATGGSLGDGDTPTSTSSLGGRRLGLAGRRVASSFNNHSVATTHRASPSVFLQLYYGPSSNFSMLNSIYQKIETRRDEERRRRGEGHNNNNNNNNNNGGPAAAAAASSDADDADATRGVEEIGPGLDLFNNRRLYFGDLASGNSGVSLTAAPAVSDGGAALLFVDRALAKRLLEHYLNTYWLLVPIWTRRTFRARLGRLYGGGGAGDWRPAGPEDPATVIVLLALALGTSVLGEERTAQYLYGRAKAWAAALDGIVNVQTVQIALLMSIFETERARPNSSFLMAGVAVRRAVAAGMHKGVVGRRRQRQGMGGGGGGGGGGTGPDDETDPEEDTRQGRITIWGVFFWETWLCFSLGRPSAFPQAEMDVPFPEAGDGDGGGGGGGGGGTEGNADDAGDRADMGLLQAAVRLARIMAQCAARIYREHHDSLLPMWNAANEIRRELRAFAEQHSQQMGFAVGDQRLEMSQTILSAFYHHTLLLTFRPFVVLRAKLRQTTDAALPTPPAWLDTACDYCLEAARHAVAFLARAAESNELCRAVRYMGFFLEGASHAMAFELLQQDQEAGRVNLPWLRLAIRVLNMLGTEKQHLPVDVASNVEQMVRVVYPDFRADGDEDEGGVGVGMGMGMEVEAAVRENQEPVPLQETTLGALAAAAAAAPAAVAPVSDLTAAAAAAPQPGLPTAAAVAGSTAALPPLVQQQQPPQQQRQLPPLAPLAPQLPPVLRPSAPATTHAAQGRGLLNAAANDAGSTANSIVPPLLFPYTTGAAAVHPGSSSSNTGPSPGTNANPGTLNPDAPGDLSLADLGWNFDFATMDLESFLSIEPNMPMGGPHTFW